MMAAMPDQYIARFTFRSREDANDLLLHIPIAQYTASVDFLARTVSISFFSDHHQIYEECVHYLLSSEIPFRLDWS